MRHIMSSVALTSYATMMADKGGKNAPPPPAPETPPQVPAPVETPAPEGEAVDEAVKEGIRSRRAIMLRQFIPTQDWINKNVVAPGKGTKAMIGRIWGVATSTESKPFTFPDGKVTTTIGVRGVFQTENYITGELTEGTMVFFPLAYSEKIHALFQPKGKDKDGNLIPSDVRIVQVDCDVGLEATGKMIPYEWVVVAYREGEEMAILKKLRGSRGRPANAAPRLAAPTAPAQLTGPAS